MYLFDKEPTYFEEPWPHIVIDNVLPADAAAHMRDNFPPTEPTPKRGHKRHGDYLEDSVFKEFHSSIHENEDHIHKTMDELFGQSQDELYIARALYRDHHPTEAPRIIRPWHIDDPSKKYKFLLYLGSGEGGWFEQINPFNKKFKRHTFEHNRLIVFHNSVVTAHRFYTSTNNRKTIGFSSAYSDPLNLSYEPLLAKSVLPLIMDR